MKNNQRGFDMIGVIIVIWTIVAGIIGWVFFKKAQVPTAMPEAIQPNTPVKQAQMPENNKATTLRNYSSAKWGFAVKYPVQYETKTDLEETREFDFSIRKIGDPVESQNSDGVCGNCAFRLQILTDFIGDEGSGGFQTPEAWVKFQKSVGQNYSQKTFSGKVAYIASDQKTGRKTYLIFLKNGSMYDRYDISIKANDSDAEIMLSNFGFIK